MLSNQPTNNPTHLDPRFLQQFGIVSCSRHASFCFCFLFVSLWQFTLNLVYTGFLFEQGCKSSGMCWNYGIAHTLDSFWHWDISSGYFWACFNCACVLSLWFLCRSNIVQAGVPALCSPQRTFSLTVQNFRLCSVCLLASMFENRGCF